MTTNNELTEELIKEALRNSEAGKYFYDIWYAGTVSQQEKWMKMFEAGMKAGFELGQKGQWRPMETAPKDSTQVIVKFVNDSDGTVEIKNAWFEGSWRRICHLRNAYEYFSFGKIVGWMPLPESPGE